MTWKVYIIKQGGKASCITAVLRGAMGNADDPREALLSYGNQPYEHRDYPNIASKWFQDAIFILILPRTGNPSRYDQQNLYRWNFITNEPDHAL